VCCLHANYFFFLDHTILDEILTNTYTHLFLRNGGTGSKNKKESHPKPSVRLYFDVSDNQFFLRSATSSFYLSGTLDKKIGGDNTPSSLVNEVVLDMI
jgi:hypothetical protein